MEVSDKKSYKYLKPLLVVFTTKFLEWFGPIRLQIIRRNQKTVVRSPLRVSLGSPVVIVSGGGLDRWRSVTLLRKT